MEALLILGTGTNLKFSLVNHIYWEWMTWICEIRKGKSEKQVSGIFKLNKYVPRKLEKLISFGEINLEEAKLWKKIHENVVLKSWITDLSVIEWDLKFIGANGIKEWPIFALWGYKTIYWGKRWIYQHGLFFTGNWAALDGLINARILQASMSNICSSTNRVLQEKTIPASMKSLEPCILYELKVMTIYNDKNNFFCLKWKVGKKEK